ncbi:aspartate kinase, partial [Vibrio anguillarum]|nr:aspartate kinase [Vibrio anguillarum]
LLTTVGLLAQELVERSCELLAEQGIEVSSLSVDKQSLMLVMQPQHVDKAANILHEAYIGSDELLTSHLKHASLG